MQGDGRRRWTRGIGAATAGGALAGAAAAVHVALSARLDLGVIGLTAVALLDGALGAVVGAIALLVAGWTLPRQHREVAALAWGAAAAAAAGVAVALVEQGALGVPGPAAATLGSVAVLGAAWYALRVAGRWRFGTQALAGLVVAALVVGGGAPRVRVPGGKPATATMPNLLLITTDGLRADRVPPPGAHGLGRLVAEGSRLGTLVAPGGEAAAGADALLRAAPPVAGRAADDGLLSTLTGKGYAVGAFLPHGMAVDDLTGAHVVDDEPSWPVGWSLTVGGRLARALGAAPPSPRRDLDTARRAARFVSRAAGVWAVWVHLEDPLPPFDPIAPFDTRFDPGVDPRQPDVTPLQARAPIDPAHGDALDGVTDPAWVIARYDGEVAALDAAIDVLLDAVDDAELVDRTVVVVAGVRGLALGDGQPTYGASGVLQPAVLHVPGVLRMPGRLPAGHRVDTPAEVADVGATVRELLGVGQDGSTAPSLRPTLTGDGLARRVARAAADGGAAIRGPGAWLRWTPTDGHRVLRVAGEPVALTPADVASWAAAMPEDVPRPDAATCEALAASLRPRLSGPAAP